METGIAFWLVGLFGDVVKSAVKRGGGDVWKMLGDAREEEDKALFAALPLAFEDFTRFTPQDHADEFHRLLKEKESQQDKEFGEAIVHALLVEPSGAVVLSSDLQSRIPSDLHSAALAFLSQLHRHLWNQPPFDKFLEAKSSQDQLRVSERIAQAAERISPRPFPDEETRYLAQLIERTELLEFVGIPEPRDAPGIKLEDIFVPLGAEEKIEGLAPIEDDFDINLSVHEVEIQLEGREALDQRIRAQSRTTRRVTIDEALRAHTHLMVLGDPGAGKSTLLGYLTLVAARGMKDGGDHKGSPLQEPRLPIFIRLRDYAASNEKSLAKFFRAQAEKSLQINLSPDFFERALEDGRCLVCLDGLDEVFVSDQRVDVRDAVAALATRYPRNRFIVTSRSVGYESAPLDRRTFAHHTILPFTESEIETFVRKWYAARERNPLQAKSQAEHLFNTIKGSDRLRKLAENPLMLTIIALVHQRAQGKLPEARVELYDRCAETLIEEWDKWKGLAPEDRERPYYQLRRRLLERAAYWMHIESQEADVAQISKRALEMKIAESLVEDKTLNLSEDTARIEAKQFVALATSRTGILVEREQGAVSFIHLTFQEYFAASDLYWRYHKTPDASWQAIQPHLYDSRWLEVILLLLGRLNDDGDTPSIIVEKILRERDKFDEIVHRNLGLTILCLADHVNVRETLHNEIVDALFELACEESPRYLSLCYDAVWTLGILSNDGRASENLLKLAQDQKVDIWVRGIAAEVLGRIGQADYSIRILLTLVNAKELDASLRVAVAQALGRLGQIDNATQLLLEFAQDKSLDMNARYDAVNRLNDPGYPSDKAIHALLTLMQSEEVDLRVRYSAVKALGNLGRADDLIVRGLITFVQDESIFIDFVQIAAIEALGKLGRTDDLVIQALLMFAQNKEVRVNDEVRRAAIATLGELGHADSVVTQSLYSLLQQEEVSPELQLTTAQVLCKLGHKDEATEVLLDLVKNEKVGQHLKIAAAETLIGELKRTDSILIPTLLKMSQIRVWKVWQQEAIAALDKLGYTDQMVNLLLERVQYGKEMSEGERLFVAQRLEQLGRTEEAMQLLLALARDEQVGASERRNAIQTLGKLGHANDTVIQSLLILGQDNEIDAGVRCDTIEALGLLGKKKPRVAFALLELAGDKNSDVRNASYRALKEVVGNLRYAEISKQKVVGSKQ